MDRRAAVRVGLSAVVVVLLGGFLGPLTPPAGADTRLDVAAGFAGFHVPGRALPVQVTVTAERLVSGELAVLGAGGKEPVASLPVEVAGGSVKRFTLVVPGGVVPASGGVDVELRVGGRAVGRGRSEIRSAEDAELVGLGPQLVEGRSVPGPAPLAVDAGVARFAAIDPGLLAAAPPSLEALSAVALASGELAGLAPGVRAALLRWVGSGGHLLVDEPTGTAVDGLPAEWQPGPAGRVVAGTGEVRLTGDAMSAGRWAGLVEPGSVGRSDGFAFGSAESVADSLAGDAGLHLPKLSWLLGFLGVYILAVGPVTGFVLRRRRRPDLAWVVVPGLAVLFTVLAYVAGNQLRPGAGLAHGSVLETDASGPVATSWVALTRRAAGTARVDLPAGWTIEGTEQGSGRLGPLGTPSVGLGAEGPEARLRLASGEFGVFKASGPVAVQGQLEVRASSPADGQANGTVRNGLPFAVDDVVVFVGSYRARVGRLAAGEQHDWSVGPTDKVVDPSGSEAWMNETNGFRANPLVNLSLWQSAQDDLGTDGDPTGAAMAVGWTSAWQPAFTVDGKERRAPGRTAVVGRAPVTVTNGRVTDLAVAADVVRGPSLNPWGAKFAGAGGGAGVAGEATVVKLTLPAGVTLPAAAPGDGGAGGGAKGRGLKVVGEGRHLALRTSLTLSDVAVWQNGAWQHLPVPFQVNNLQGMIRFKQGIAVNGGVVLRGPAVGVPDPPTPETTIALPPPAMVPTTAPMVAPPMPMPMPVPGGAVAVQVGPGGGAVPVDVILPGGIGTDGVLFLRIVVDPNSLSPESVFSLVVVDQ
ncbi:MAG TPA: hypothetical protein VGR20_02085 [Acidimicrobiia bacterium]|nr:hypothetical protein [Acidimicrobiia bacterium]